MDKKSNRPKCFDMITRAKRYFAKQPPSEQAEKTYADIPTPEPPVRRRLHSANSYASSASSASSEYSDIEKRPYDQASLHYVHIFFNGFEEKPLPPLPQAERAMRCRGIYIPEYWKDKPLPPLPIEEMPPSNSKF